MHHSLDTLYRQLARAIWRHDLVAVILLRQRIERAS